MVPAILGAARFSRWGFLICMDLMVGLSAWEFFRLAQRKGANPNIYLGIFLTLGASWSFFIGGTTYATWTALVSVLLLLGVELARSGAGSFLINIGAVLFGVFYTGWLGSVPLLLQRHPEARSFADSADLVVVAFASIWIMDTMAYFVGRRFGRRRLLPKISPGKTVEGAWAGAFGAVVSMFVGSWILDFLSYGEALVMGLIVASTGQIGDLVESKMKRDAGVKDTSSIIPGHGGVLDRFDSMFFAFPLIYLYADLFGVFQ